MGQSGKTFISNHKIVKASASGVTTLSTGTATSSGLVIDTKGYTGVVFIINVHSACATASCLFSVKGAATSASCIVATSTDLSGTGVLAQSGSATGENGSSEMIIIEVKNPAYRYLRLHAARNTEGNTFSAIAILYGPTGFASQDVPKVPTNAGAFGVTDASGGNVRYELHHSPVQGTA